MDSAASRTSANVWKGIDNWRTTPALVRRSASKAVQTDTALVQTNAAANQAIDHRRTVRMSANLFVITLATMDSAAHRTHAVATKVTAYRETFANLYARYRASTGPALHQTPANAEMATSW